MPSCRGVQTFVRSFEGGRQKKISVCAEAKKAAENLGEYGGQYIVRKNEAWCGLRISLRWRNDHH